MSSYQVTVAGREYAVTVKSRTGTQIIFDVAGEEYCANVAIKPRESFSRGFSSTLLSQPAAPLAVAVRSASNEIRSPIPGIVSEVLVSVGQSIEQGSTIAIIEAMKMENPIRAPRAGIVSAVHVEKGSEVATAALLVTLKE